MNVEIIGVNRMDQEPFNPTITDERSLPWLQDTPEDRVWDLWQVTYRDVRILDSQNRLFAVFNVTDHDLAYPDNREALKQLFLAAARAVDADADGLADDWEQRFLGLSSAGSLEDADGDGASNFAEFAFGTDPKNSKSVSSIRPSLISIGGRDHLGVTFRRRAGSVLDYFVEASSDLVHWTADTTEIAVRKPLRNLYDGTGTSEVTYSLVNPAGQSAQKFIRVRAVPRKRG